MYEGTASTNPAPSVGSSTCSTVSQNDPVACPARGATPHRFHPAMSNNAALHDLPNALCLAKSYLLPLLPFLAKAVALITLI